MGACYSVNLDVCVIDESGAILALQKHIEEDKRTNYSLDEYAKEGITTETFDDLMRIFLAGWKGQEVDININSDETTTYSNAFNASYGWESVMIEMFETLVPYIREDSELVIYPDNGRCEVTIQNGIAKTDYIYESRTYRCVLCDEEFDCEDDAYFEECLKEELLEHLATEHKRAYAKCKKWDSERIINTYYEREDD